MIIFKFIICTVLLLVPISGILIAIGLFVEGMRCIKKESDDDGDDHLRIIITYRPDDFKSDSEKPADSGKSD